MNTPANATPSRARPGSAVLNWHRRIGLALALLFLVVCVTGFLLNHAEGLRLRNVTIDADWLYRWYGMQPKGEPVAHVWDARHQAVWLDGTLYRDAVPVAQTDELRGAVALPTAWAAVTAREVVLLDAGGALIERLGGAAVPGGEITRAGVLAGAVPRLVLGTAAGRTFAYDENLLSFEELAAGDARRIDWSDRVPVRADLREAVVAAYRGDGLTLHRIVLDLHSGRFFGRAGVFVVDALALGLLFLAASGVYSAFAGRRR